MADILQVDYEQLDAIAAIFNRTHADIETLIGSIKGPFEQLKGGDWLGAGSRAFVHAMEQKLLPAFARWHDVTGEAVGVTHNIKQLMREAEEEAAQQFQQSSEADSGRPGAPNPSTNTPDSAPQTLDPSDGPTLLPQTDDPLPLSVRMAWKALELLSDAGEIEAKQSIYQSIVDSILDSFGTASVPVVIEDLIDGQNQDVRGKFDPIRNVLIIDIDNIDDPTTLITAIHEARHAIQHAAAERFFNDPTATWPWNGITKLDAQKWWQRFQMIAADQESGVPIGRGGKPSYDEDPLEIDAREYADEYADNMTSSDWLEHIQEAVPVLQG